VRRSRALYGYDAMAQRFIGSAKIVMRAYLGGMTFEFCLATTGAKVPDGPD
jgi:hypothetical protein